MSNPITPQLAKRLRRKLRGLLVFSTILAVLGAVAYATAQSLMGPAEGTVIMTVPLAPKAPPPVELEQFDGKNLSFARPATYAAQVPKADTANPAGVLETHSFIASGMVSKILTVTVTQEPSGQLSDDASYQMRALHPERYKLTERIIKGEKVVTAANTQEYQLTSFWMHGTRLLTFSLTGVTTDSEAVTKEYNTMLDTVIWR